MLLGPSPIGYAVCYTARMACVDVDDHDPAPIARRGVTPAMEGDLRPIGGPRRGAVAKALGGMGDLADVASVRVHHEDEQHDDPQTPGEDRVSPPPAPLRGLLLRCLLLRCLLLRWFPWGTSTRLRWRRRIHERGSTVRTEQIIFRL